MHHRNARPFCDRARRCCAAETEFRLVEWVRRALPLLCRFPPVPLRAVTRQKKSDQRSSGQCSTDGVDTHEPQTETVVAVDRRGVAANGAAREDLGEEPAIAAHHPLRIALRTSALEIFELVQAPFPDVARHVQSVTRGSAGRIETYGADLSEISLAGVARGVIDIRVRRGEFTPGEFPAVAAAGGRLPLFLGGQPQRTPLRQ